MMAHDETDARMTRRDFLGRALAGTAAIALSGMPGCGARTPVERLRVNYEKPLRLVNCSVIDVKTGTVRRGAVVTIMRDTIASITTEDATAHPGETFDLGGKYVIPGLIDAHCHITMPGTLLFDFFELYDDLKQNRRNYTECIRAGITAVRDTGALVSELHRAIDDIAGGGLIGPRVFYCNSIINIAGSHPDIRPSDVSIFGGPTSLITGSVTVDFTDLSDLKYKLEQNVERGASFIKLTVDNRSVFCGRGEIPVYTDEQLRHIFAFAERKGLPVIAHNHFKYGFDRITRYPLHSLEHSLSDAPLSDDEAAMMASKKIACVPTMVIASYLSPGEAFEHQPATLKTETARNEIAINRAYYDSLASRYVQSRIHRNNRANMELFRVRDCGRYRAEKKFLPNPELYYGVLRHGPENLRKMFRAGVLIGCGTDAGMPFSYHGALWRELELMHRVGISAKDVLRCATYNNALILGAADKMGSVEPGKWADLAVLDANPLENIQAYRSPALVFKGGRLMYSAYELDRREGGVVIAPVYEGDTRDGRREGAGRYRWRDGSTFEGSWRDDRRDGPGEYRYPGGEAYLGEFKADRRNGVGEYTWPTGERYQGQWKDGRMHGYGTFTTRDGTRFTGRFEEGKYRGK